MAIVYLQDTILTSIAEAIRTKSETTDTYKPGEMADAIQNIPASGGEEYPNGEEMKW